MNLVTVRRNVASIDETRNALNNLIEKPHGKRQYGNLNAGGNIILKRILEK
jgi:hypothetical protein